jgi:hypothetical protein
LFPHFNITSKHVRALLQVRWRMYIEYYLITTNSKYYTHTRNGIKIDKISQLRELHWHGWFILAVFLF